MSTVAQLVDQLEAASQAYYNTGDSVLTDRQFDEMRERLKSLAPDHPFFQRVGSAVSAHRDSVQLLMHMGSQNKASTDDDFFAWYEKQGSPVVVMSDKLDGSSMEAVYEDGALVRVATRGDGTTGMDITRNAKLWTGLPHRVNVSGRLIVRGEAQLSVPAWTMHFSDKANPRNAGNGIVVCDSDFERNRHICFHAFDVVHPTIRYDFFHDKLSDLKKLGFDTASWQLCETVDAIQQARADAIALRPDLAFEIDGLIVAIDDLAIQEQLGFSDGGTRPKGQIAWKFDTDKVVTEVTGMTLSIGHTGKIVPTATLSPVQLAGTTVRNVLLNNFDYIAKNNINVGDMVEVEKGGDIIPHVTRVVRKLSDGPYPPPSDWKGYPLVKEGADWKVTDEDCPDLTFMRIRNWIRKVGIKHLGEQALMALMDVGLVRDIPDLYTLDAKRVADVQTGKGVIGSNADKICSEIDKTRSLPLDVFMGSLSIKHLGRSRAALVNLPSIEAYLTESLAGKPCSDVGVFSPEVADEIHRSLTARRETIQALCEYITIEEPKELVTDGKLSGQQFCFSGVRLKGDMKERFEALGGVDSGKVNNDTDYLVVKDPASTSSKVQKARKLGVAVLSLGDFEALL